MPTLEEPAREQIDVMLIACGSAIQDYKRSNLGATRGIAEQSGFYAENVPDFLATLSSNELPFLYV